MLTPQQFHNYQRKATIHSLTHDDSMLWLGMSLGKTPVTLTVIDHRMRCQQVQKTLVIAPLRVVHQVWEREARKWSHLQHLRFAKIVGTEDQRQRQFFADADIYLINYENLAWLSNMLHHYYISQGKPIPFQMCVYDEISKMKNSQAQRIKGGKRITNKGKPNESSVKLLGWRHIIPHFKYRIGLTGTPASNGYLDLFGQYLCVDGGKRLGEYVTGYRDSYFAKGFDGWTYTPTDLGKKWIEHKIADITLKMDTEDYLELPEVIHHDLMVDLPENIMRQYREVERDMFTRLDDGSEIEVFSKTSISNKCLQFANGSPYLEPMKPEYTALHDAKMEALDSVIEEAAGSPVLVGYLFRSDAERMMQRYKSIRPVDLTKTKASDLGRIIDETCAGKHRLLIGHPASMGHGIDGLQDCVDDLVWFGIPWSLELYDQMYRRPFRQGRNRVGRMHRIMARGTIDVAVADALRRKDGDQSGLKNAIQRYRDGLIPSDGQMCFL